MADSDGILVPIKGIMELQLALITHLHDKGIIDKSAIIDLLKKQISPTPKNADEMALALFLQGIVHWLQQLGVGPETFRPSLN
jgi:hypothetical protein